MRDVASKSWRPVGAWGITLNAILGLPLMAAVVIIRPDAEIGVLGGAYASVLAAFGGIYWVRQWGKQNGSEE